MVDEQNTGEEESSALAAELMLGLLEGEDRAATLRRQISDPEFAGQVDWWQARLDPMYHEFPEAEPDAGVWNGIEKKLDENGLPAVNDAANDNATALKRWRMGAIFSGGLAACLALALLFNPGQVTVPDPGTGAQTAVAQLTGPIDGLVLAVSYNTGTAQMRVDVEGMPETQTEPEIWIRADDGTVHSLGQIGRDGISEMVLAEADRDLLTGGAQLFLTMEEPSETPHDRPSGEPVATGKISFI